MVSPVKAEDHPFLCVHVFPGHQHTGSFKECCCPHHMYGQCSQASVLAGRLNKHVMAGGGAAESASVQAGLQGEPLRLDDCSSGRWQAMPILVKCSQKDAKTVCPPGSHPFHPFISAPHTTPSEDVGVGPSFSLTATHGPRTRRPLTRSTQSRPSLVADYNTRSTHSSAPDSVHSVQTLAGR